jgi:hypothetical protein
VSPTTDVKWKTIKWALWHPERWAPVKTFRSFTRYTQTVLVSSLLMGVVFLSRQEASATEPNLPHWAEPTRTIRAFGAASGGIAAASGGSDMAYPQARRKCSSVVNAVAPLTVLVAISPASSRVRAARNRRNRKHRRHQTASTTEGGASSGTGSPPAAAAGHTLPTLVIDGGSVDLPTDPSAANCKPVAGNPGAWPVIIWSGGRATGPEPHSDSGYPGIAVIVVNAVLFPAAPNSVSIKLANLKGYEASNDGGPEWGTATITGPSNGWYTFSGTIAEDVTSEATGLKIPGVAGPLHPFTLNIECANYTNGHE